ncbi:hypothetical protein HK102_007828 [Quaeritorhiza haematococci]|nr:hypothetical protein HK102_007828 [Quaeritorhiza haematococci]
MDLVKAFTNGSQAYQITVKGDHENPLFKAVDVAAILGIGNVRETLRDYDEDEKVTVSYTDSPRAHGVNYLTEVGLYRIILASRKPFAKQFKKWVCSVIKEIRLTGQYQLQKQVEDREAKLLEFQQEKEAIEARAKEAEAKAAELEERIKTKKYEAVTRDQFVYAMKESAELHNNKHKIGKTSNISNRKSNFQTSHASRVEIVHQVSTSNAHVIEQVVHSLLQRYHHGKEFFNCEITHSINLMDFTSAVYDTLKGCYEFITREEIAAKLHECIDGVLSSNGMGERNETDNEQAPQSTKEKVEGFLRHHCQLDSNFQVEQDAFLAKFRTAMSQHFSRKEVKAWMSQKFGTGKARNDFITVAEGRRRGWKGLRLRE